MKDSTKIFLGVGAAGVGLLTLYSMAQRKKKPNLFIKKSLPFGFNAMTVPPLGIFVTADQMNNSELINHELIHWNQYRRTGLVRYYLGYAIQSLRFGYDQMPMEVEARANENEYCQTNYTQAVRDGYAKTVYNPEFRK